MLSINHIRHNFVRQADANDCGRACLAMLLRYAGKEQQMNDLFSMQSMEAAISLFQMKEISDELGLDTQCVEMDLESVDELTSPCILHTFNQHGDPHFVVLFGRLTIGKEVNYIIGDPGIDILFYDRSELNRYWPSRAALYCNIPAKQNGNIFSLGWTEIFRQLAFGKALWIVMSAMSLVTLLTGLGIAWTLQKTAQVFEPASPRLIVSYVSLLVILYFSRTLITFIRQRLLVRVTSITGEFFMSKILHEFFFFQPGQQHIPESLLKQRLKDVQIIQQANLAICSSFLPDIFTVLLITAITAYYLPVTLCCSILALGAQAYIATQKLGIQNATANTLTARVRDFEAMTSNTFSTSSQLLKNVSDEVSLKNHIKHYQALLSKGEQMGNYSNRITLTVDCVNVVYLATNYLFSLWNVYYGNLSPSEMIIIAASSFFMTTVTTRLSAILPQLDAGAMACYRLFHK